MNYKHLSIDAQVSSAVLIQGFIRQKECRRRSYRLNETWRNRAKYVSSIGIQTFVNIGSILFASARSNAAALLLQSNREKHVQVIKIPKRRMAGIGAINDTDCPYLCAHRAHAAAAFGSHKGGTSPPDHRAAGGAPRSGNARSPHCRPAGAGAQTCAAPGGGKKSSMWNTLHSSCACRDAASVVFPAAQRPSMATSTRGCVATSARIRCRRTVSKSVIQSTCRQEDVLS